MSLYLFPTPPSPSPCVSLPSLYCADKQPGAMAAEEVKCDIFFGGSLALSLKGAFSVVSLSCFTSVL